MVSLVAGILVLLALLYGAKLWSSTDPKKLLALGRTAVGYVALAGAVFTLVTGRFGIAVPLALAGLALLGKLDPSHIGGGLGGVLKGLFRGAGGPKVSRVSSPLLEMELDHGSGRLAGRIVSGPLAGTDLDSLDVPALLGLRAVCDAQSLALLEAYLDRRAPAWREDGQQNAGGRSAGGNSLGAMTEEEAYQILGLEPGAGESAVRAAHRSLMKKLHPDHGGSSYLASRINQAKDVILRKHR